ncbi:hypothetical protein [Cryptosporangium japonicum]|uniref:Secreted protein n=1 Tax=Cryptosporangium japonicum TaxID=80872 RepID=A0ABP3DY21_9ACTN
MIKRARMARLLVPLALAATAVVMSHAPAEAASTSTASTAVALHHETAIPQGRFQQQNGDYEVSLGRVWHSDNWRCDLRGCDPRRKYTYIKLTAPGDIGQEAWNRMSSFTQCVVNKAGVAIVISTVASGGVSLPVILGAFSVAASECGAVTMDEFVRARVVTYVGR